MSRAHKTGVLAAVLLTVVATLIALYTPGGSGPSALSPGPGGWLAARKYLAARGAEITLLDHQLGEEPGDTDASAVLVTGFPWSSAALQADFEPYRAFAQAGATVIIAYSGQIPRGAEKRFFDHFGLAARRARRSSPLGYGGWRSWQKERWKLLPGPALGGEIREISLRPPAAVPQASTGAQPWFHAAPGNTATAARSAEEPSAGRRLVDDVLEKQGTYLARPLAEEAAVIFSVPFGDGRMIWLPADVLSNARLGEAGNAGLLESLLAAGAARWSFDEYHHGLRPPGERVTPVPQRVFDLFLVHLLAIYLLAVWFLARRFGPVWREPTAHSGSTAGLLRGMGILHETMGHHRWAGELLIERVQQLDDANPAFSSALSSLQPATNSRQLVNLAAHVARIRREHGSPSFPTHPLHPDQEETTP